MMKKSKKKGNLFRKVVILPTLVLMGGSIILNSGFVQSAKDNVYSNLEREYLNGSKVQNIVVEETTKNIEETTNIESNTNTETTPVVEETPVKEETVKSKNYSVGNQRTTEEIIWDRLRSEGYTEIQTAGIVGNIWAECDMDYTLIEKEKRVGIGLIQWSWDRRDKFEQVTGKNWKSLDVQLDFLINEMNNKYGIHWTEGKSNFFNAKTPEDAAYWYCESYERPSVKRMSVRKARAQEAFERCAGRPVQK